jgi:hypothetical protein
MKVAGSGLFARSLMFQSSLAVVVLMSGLSGGTSALADDDDIGFRPGNLLVSRDFQECNLSLVLRSAFPFDRLTHGQSCSVIPPKVFAY